MNIQNLQNKYPELIAYVREHGYSERYAVSLKRQINTILEKADREEWTSYNDVRRWHKERLTPRTSWLSFSLAQVDVIERFAMSGELPNDKLNVKPYENITLTRGSYNRLVPEFKAIIETYRNFEDQRNAMNPVSIDRYALNASSFLYKLQCGGITNVAGITQESILAAFINEDGTPRYSFSYKYIVASVFKANAVSNPELWGRLVAYLPNLRVNRKNIQYLTDEEVAQIKNTLTDPYSNLSYRDKAIGTLALCYGLRRCDIAKIKINEIDLIDDKIRFCQQKTKVLLELPLTIFAGNAVHDYVTLERSQSDCEFVFLSEKPPYGGLTAGHFQRISTRIMKAAGIRQNVGDRKGFHIFRHRLATDLLGKGIAQPIISEIAGHTSPVSLEPYLGSDFVHLKECALSIDRFPVSQEVFEDA